MANGFFSLAQLGTVSDRPGLPRCGACGLLSGCISPKMPIDGRGKRRVLVVGEAPGETEDRQGRPFIGDAGKLLRRIFREVGVSLNDCWITNSILCRPPKNRIEDKHIDACRPALLSTIVDLKPRVILLLGASAAKTLIEQEWKDTFDKISRWAGFRIPSQRFRAWLCPTFHPSYLMRMGEDRVLMKLATEHVSNALLAEREDVPDCSDLKSKVEIVTSEREVIKRLKELARCKGRLAFDYEATGLKPEASCHRIVSVSFCFEGKETWACDLTDAMKPALSSVLRNKRLWKVASNLKYEERWTRKMMGHGVANWGWDTMLASHVLDNRGGISSIKFQAYVRLGVVGYEYGMKSFMRATTANGMNRIQEAAPIDRLLYNGLDSLLEFMVMEKQVEEMEGT